VASVGGKITFVPNIMEISKKSINLTCLWLWNTGILIRKIFKALERGNKKCKKKRAM
jgi:hypothetical protein